MKKNIADILDSVYEQDHVRVDTGFAEEGELIGANLAAHIEALEKQMRDAAADLNFEDAARLRDEIKRLQEVELAVADDPLARDAGIENTQDSRKRKAQGKPAKAKKGGLFRKNTLDEMTVGRTEKPLAPDSKNIGESRQPRQHKPRRRVHRARPCVNGRLRSRLPHEALKNDARDQTIGSSRVTSYGEEMRRDRGAPTRHMELRLSPEDKSIGGGSGEAGNKPATADQTKVPPWQGKLPRLAEVPARERSNKRRTKGEALSGTRKSPGMGRRNP